MPTDDELPPEITSLFDDARAQRPPAGAKDRVWNKIQAQIAAGAVATPSAAPAAGSAVAVRAAAITGFAAGVLSGVIGAAVVASMFAAAPQVVYERVEVTPEPTVPPVAAPSATPTSRGSVTELSTERAWLDAAAKSLDDGDLDEAMRLLETARLRYPDGKLGEEREALAIHVLIARGDAASANLAVDAFRRRHPGSPFLRQIESGLSKLPATP